MVGAYALLYSLQVQLLCKFTTFTRCMQVLDLDSQGDE